MRNTAFKIMAAFLAAAVVTMSDPAALYAVQVSAAAAHAAESEVSADGVSEDQVSADTVSEGSSASDAVSEDSSDGQTESAGLRRYGEGWLNEAASATFENGYEGSEGAGAAEGTVSAGDISIPADGKIPDGFTSDEWAVFLLVNKQRHAQNLEPLSGFSAFQKVADVRAAEISRYYSHTRPDGSQCFTAYTGAGTYSSAAENIAAGFSSPDSVMDAWMNSPGHRANILDKNLTRLAVGYAYSDLPNTSEDSGGYVYYSYWVQNFIGNDTSQQAIFIRQNQRKLSAGGSLSGLGINIAIVYEGTVSYLRLENYMCSGYDAKTPGEYTVKVTVQGCSATFPLQVVQAPVSVSISGDKVINKTVTMAVNDTAKLYATVLPSNANYKTGITWSSSSPKTVSADKSGLVTGLSYGTAVVTARTDNGKTCAVKVTVKDLYGPRADTSQITMNIHQSTTADIDVVPVSSVSIDCIKVTEPAGLDNLADSMTAGEGYAWSLSHNGTCSRAMTEKCTMDITVHRVSEAGKAVTETYIRPLTVKFVTAQPSVTFSQIQKANLFYTDAAAVYRVTCAADISDITQSVQNVQKGYTVSYNAARHLLTLTAAGLDGSTVNEKGIFRNAKVSVKVKFSDYGEAEKNLTAGTAVIPVKLAADAVSFYPGQTSYTGQLKIMASGKAFTSASAAVVKTDAGPLTLIDNKKGSYTISCMSGFTAGSLKMSVTDTEWTQPVNITIAAKQVKLPKNMSLEKTAVMMNTKTGVSDNSYTIPVSLKGSSLKIRSVSALNLDAINGEGKLNGALSADFDVSSQTFTVRLDPLKAALINRKGTYRLMLSGVTDSFAGYDSGTEVKGVLTVKLLTDAPSVSIRSSGKINLVARNDTYMTLKAVCRSMPDGTAVKSAEIEKVLMYDRKTGKYSNDVTVQSLFEIAGTSGGTFELKAVSGKELDTAGYQIVLKVRMNDAAETSAETSPFIIKPVNSPAKLSAGTAALTL